MTSHLAPEDIVDAAEGRFDPAWQAHAASCRDCAAEIAAHVALLQDLAAAKEVPEPSPLFWDHFSSRTRAAVAADPVRPARPQWMRPLVGLAAAAVILLAVLLRPASEGERTVTTTADAGDPMPLALPAVEDGPWDLVLDLASDMPYEDVQQVAAPRRGTADTLIDELTPSEREAFVKLLKSEIGDLE